MKKMKCENMEYGNDLNGRRGLFNAAGLEMRR